MSFAVLAILSPLAAAVILMSLPRLRAAAWLHLAMTLLVFALACLAPDAPGLGFVRADGLGAIFGVLAAFTAVGFAIADLGAARAAPAVPRRRPRPGWCQAALGLTLLGLYADDIMLLWLAVSGLAVAIALPLARLPDPAGPKLLVLAAGGALLALFGTLLVDLAARPALGAGASSLAALAPAVAGLDRAAMSLAFVPLVFGYGALAVLGWLPALLAGTPPLLAGLAGALLPNLALLTILRFRHLAGPPPGAAPLLLALGLAALLLAAAGVARRRPAGRFLGLLGIAQAGLAAVAFGLGGGAAVFGGLLNMLVQALAQAGAWQRLSRAASLPGAGDPAGFAGHGGRLAGWSLGGCLFILSGLPPGGLFVSQYLIVSQLTLTRPWLLAPLLLGLLPCAWAALRRAAPPLLHTPPGTARLPADRPGAALAGINLLLAVGLGYAMPAALVAALSAAALAQR